MTNHHIKAHMEIKAEGSVGKPDPVKAIAAEIRKLREISFGDPYEREAAGILAALRVLAELQNAEAAKLKRHEKILADNQLKKIVQEREALAQQQQTENTETWPPSHEG